MANVRPLNLDARDGVGKEILDELHASVFGESREKSGAYIIGTPLFTLTHDEEVTLGLRTERVP